MNKEFLKMQKLAGLITENQFREKVTENEEPDKYQRIIGLYIDSLDDEYVAGFYDVTHREEVAKYLKTLKPYPKVGTVEELASTIKEIDDKINEITDYSDDHYDEEVKPRLDQIASDDSNLKNTVDEVVVVLNKLYGREDDDKDDYDEFDFLNDPKQDDEY